MVKYYSITGFNSNTTVLRTTSDKDTAYRFATDMMGNGKPYGGEPMDEVFISKIVTHFSRNKDGSGFIRRGGYAITAMEDTEKQDTKKLDLTVPDKSVR